MNTEPAFFSSHKPTVVACIPAYNEQKNIAGVLVQVSRLVDRVIVCDDGSTDMTAQIAEAMGATVIRHDRNSGYGSALRTLFDEARRSGAEVAITIDGDGQHDAKQIPALVERLAKGDCDLVIGSRFLSKEDVSKVPFYRRAGLKVITGLVSNGSYEGITDSQSGFRAYTREALGSLSVTENGMGASTEILVKARQGGLRVAEVPVTISYSKGSLVRNPVLHGLEVVLSTLKHLSITRPLVFYGVPGLLFLGLSLSFWIWTLRLFAETKVMVTNIALMAVGTTITGLMFMTTAIILWVLTSLMKDKQ